MKRFVPSLLVALAIIAASSTPAFAAALRVSASAHQNSGHTVVFTGHISRPARISVKVYLKGWRVRTLSVHRSGKQYTASWKPVSSGRYSYRVTASASRTHKVATGSIQVVTPAVASISYGTGRWIGLYVPGAPSDMSYISAAEAMDGTHTAVVNFFVSDSESFPTQRCQNIASHGSTPLITLEFWSIDGTGLSAITGGSKDAYIRSFADAAKAYGGEVWLRPFHEMNGNWYPWGGPVGSNSPSQLVQAWRHVHDIFAAEGASNVKFVWCVNNDSVGGDSSNKISAYWPGDDYVDYAAIDGYNAGDTQDWSSWRSFKDCFSSAYGSITSLTSRPVFIAETSSVESGGSKAQWIHDMFTAVPKYFPRMVGVCWFDANLSSDWRIDTSSASADAFAAGATAGF
jgi:beta-mannanase